MFDSVGQRMIKSTLAGYNGTIMAYGQTGAGKTFTISGSGIGSEIGLTDAYKNRGLCPRAISSLFRGIASSTEVERADVKVRVSYMEIYNEMIFDLLRDNDVDDGVSYTAGAGTQSVTNWETKTKHGFGAGHVNTGHEGKLDVKEGANGTYVKGLTTPVVRDEEEATEWLFRGQANRAMAEHKLNQVMQYRT